MTKPRRKLKLKKDAIKRLPELPGDYVRLLDDHLKLQKQHLNLIDEYIKLQEKQSKFLGEYEKLQREHLGLMRKHEDLLKENISLLKAVGDKSLEVKRREKEFQKMYG